MIGRTMRGLAGAVRARPAIFAVVTVGMFALHVMVPPLILSLVRKPADYFAFNAWLANLPSFLASSDVALSRKIEVVPKLALVWFSSSNPYGVEWGFTVDVADLVRFLVTSALIGVYFALWAYRRAQPAVTTWRVHASRGGVLGGFVTVLGLSTGPCSVMGCGAPVMPVIALALAGLSSTTLKFLHDLSTVATAVVLATLVVSVAYLANLAGASAPPTQKSA